MGSSFALRLHGYPTNVLENPAAEQGGEYFFNERKQNSGRNICYFSKYKSKLFI